MFSGPGLASRALGRIDRRADPAHPPPLAENPSNPPEAPCPPSPIRANYVTTGDDQTIRVVFSNFQITGRGAYESVYKGDSMLGARGHVMQALSIHAKYQVLLHFADPLADDQLRTYDANFKCYNN